VYGPGPGSDSSRDDQHSRTVLRTRCEQSAEDSPEDKV
jgi:hypothetical protein